MLLRSRLIAGDGAGFRFCMTRCTPFAAWLSRVSCRDHGVVVANAVVRL